MYHLVLFCTDDRLRFANIARIKGESGTRSFDFLRLLFLLGGGRPEAFSIPPSSPSSCLLFVFWGCFLFSLCFPFLFSFWGLRAFASPRLGFRGEEPTGKSWRNEGRNICDDVRPLTALDAVSLLYFSLFSPWVPSLCRVAFRLL